jgi:hypothetical protein
MLKYLLLNVLEAKWYDIDKIITQGKLRDHISHADWPGIKPGHYIY